MKVLILYPNLSFTKELWVILDYHLNLKKRKLSKQHKASENYLSVTDVKNKKETNFITFEQLRKL